MTSPRATEAPTIGVVGAGAMGSGIAQVAATAGHRVVLADAHAGAVGKARDATTSALSRLVDKGRLTATRRDEILARITFVNGPLGADLSAYRDCGVVIE